MHFYIAIFAALLSVSPVLGITRLEDLPSPQDFSQTLNVSEQRLGSLDTVQRKRLLYRMPSGAFAGLMSRALKRLAGESVHVSIPRALFRQENKILHLIAVAQLHEVSLRIFLRIPRLSPDRMQIFFDRAGALAKEGLVHGVSVEVAVEDSSPDCRDYLFNSYSE